MTEPLKQAAAGVVTRMAVLYELLAGREAPDRAPLLEMRGSIWQ